MRDSMIFYRSFYEAIKELPLDKQGEIYDAIFTYGLDFTEPKLTGISKTIWTLIKPQIDSNIEKYKNGCKPKTKQKESKIEAKEKQKESKIEANVNDNENVNVKDKVINNNIIESIDFDILLAFINKTFSRKFTVINQKVRKKYESLLKQGYKKNQIQEAINNCRKNQYHKETNFQYCTPEFFSRTETIDKYSNTDNSNDNVYIPNQVLN